ncbi:MAG: hypothetical protein FWE64_01120 [Alphaproteobacteria bacterium]|nr:hypothetical protein [Alphaproteobacteria bacterium]
MCLNIHQTQQKVQDNCTISFIHAQVSDVAKLATKIQKSISDTSWINSLDIMAKLGYEARAKETIAKIVSGILTNVVNPISGDLGEIIVSTQAQDLLVGHHRHNKIPLAELWKEKKRGNPGFDFHTETPTNFIAFGEAKYNKNQSSHTIAINQIVKFIENKKDIKELPDLDKWIGDKTKSNISTFPDKSKAFTIAFSVHNKNYNEIFDNVIASPKFSELLKYPEIYIVGIEFVN